MSLRTLIPVLAMLSSVFILSCKKSNKTDPNPGNTQEEALAFTLTGVEEGAFNQALDSTFIFQVKVMSKMPAAGVATKINVVSDPAGVGLDQDSVAGSKSSIYDVTLKHLKELKTYKVTVTVSSLGNTANVAPQKIFYITNKKPL
ncbi:hypothetical protein [Chitinophaga sp. Cy-1792]|uniref:hypothetical protein n=1 Tax=Chitinophaga sp. Cy-1792 TaxID=2608339 RepID=UPI001422DB6D|nr:hypothetical protein [Chitinophaga sp. Cy-1792]NIG52141.1 hypothetical protein [Chitinophaga sp. Cy-1792]